MTINTASEDGASLDLPMAAEQQQAFEHLLSGLSNTFAMTAAQDVDRQIDAWLQRVAEALALEGAALSEFSEDGQSGRITHAWLAPGCRRCLST